MNDPTWRLRDLFLRTGSNLKNEYVIQLSCSFQSLFLEMRLIVFADLLYVARGLVLSMALFYNESKTIWFTCIYSRENPVEGLVKVPDDDVKRWNWNGFLAPLHKSKDFKGFEIHFLNISLQKCLIFFWRIWNSNKSDKKTYTKVS